VGQARRVHPLMWAVAAFFAIYFAIEPLKSMFGIS
jgi:AGZA family xanthine/uracil permease-like MFS transporter